MIYTEWGKLKEVIVGRVYDPTSIDDIEIQPKYKNFLKDILYETEEDFQTLVKIFESFDVKVYRPNHVDLSSHKNSQWNINFPLPAICPRDFHVVYGDKIINTIGGDPNRYFESIYFHDIMLEKFNEGRNYISMPKPVLPNYYEDYAKQDNKILFHSANIIKCGNALIHSKPHDNQLYPERRINQKGRGTHTGLKWLKQNLDKNLKWIEVPAAGHIDGKMALLKPGVLAVSNPDLIPSEMKNWEVIQIQKQELPNSIKKRIKEEFYNEFVVNNINHWVGFEDLPRETIFDVNVVSIDQNILITNNSNKYLEDECKKHKIECVPFNFRHRFFWDCGIHCITLDLTREDSPEDFI